MNVPDGVWRVVDPGGSGGSHAIGMHPVTGTMLFASDMGSSLLRSTNDGLTYEPAAGMGFTALVGHPVKANVWYGSEHYEWRMSTDNGSTWNVISTSTDRISPPSFGYILPGTPDILLWSVKDKLYISRDGGKTFSPYDEGLTPLDGNWKKHPIVRERATITDPTYLAHDISAGKITLYFTWIDGLYTRALDGPQWEKITDPVFPQNALPIAVAIDRAGKFLWISYLANGIFTLDLGSMKCRDVTSGIPGLRILRTNPNKPGTVWGYCQGQMGVFRSDNKGEKWHWLSRFIEGENESYKGNLPIPHRFTMWFINGYQMNVHPKNPDIIFMNDGWTTYDGGITWKGYGFQYGAKSHSWRGNGLTLLTDYEAWWDNFHPNRVYLGYSDTGIMWSENRGYSVKAIERSEHGLDTTLDQLWRKYSDEFKSFTSGSCMAFACDPEHKGAWYYAMSGKAGQHPGNSGGIILRSFNEGRTWTAVWPEISGLPNAVINDLIIMPYGTYETRKMFALVNTLKFTQDKKIEPFAGIYTSTDSGATWQLLADYNKFDQGFPPMDLVYCEAVPSVMYLCTTTQQGKRPGGNYMHGYQQDGYGRGGVYKSTDYGVSWNRVSPPDLMNCQEAAVHPENPDIVYVAEVKNFRPTWKGGKVSEKGGIFRTMNSGQAWEHVLDFDKYPSEDKQRNNFDRGAMSVTINPVLPRILYAAMTGLGIFRSIDAGSTWQRVDWENFQRYQQAYHTVSINPHDPAEFYIALFGNSFVAYRDPVAAAEIKKEEKKLLANLIVNGNFEMRDINNNPSHWYIFNWEQSGKKILFLADSPDGSGKSMRVESENEPQGTKPDSSLHTYIPPWQMTFARGKRIKVSMDMYYEEGTISEWPMIRAVETRDGYSHTIGDMRAYLVYGETPGIPWGADKAAAGKQKKWITLSTFAEVHPEAERVKIIIWASHKEKASKWYFDNVKVELAGN